MKGLEARPTVRPDYVPAVRLSTFTLIGLSTSSISTFTLIGLSTSSVSLTYFILAAFYFTHMHASVWENTLAWVPHFQQSYWMVLAFLQCAIELIYKTNYILCSATNVLFVINWYSIIINITINNYTFLTALSNEHVSESLVAVTLLSLFH